MGEMRARVKWLDDAIAAKSAGMAGAIANGQDAAEAVHEVTVLTDERGALIGAMAILKDKIVEERYEMQKADRIAAVNKAQLIWLQALDEIADIARLAKQTADKKAILADQVAAISALVDPFYSQDLPLYRSELGLIRGIIQALPDAKVWERALLSVKSFMFPVDRWVNVDALMQAQQAEHEREMAEKRALWAEKLASWEGPQPAYDMPGKPDLVHTNPSRYGKVVVKTRPVTDGG